MSSPQQIANSQRELGNEFLVQAKLSPAIWGPMRKVTDLLKGQNLRKERRRNDAPQRNIVSRTRTARLCKPRDSSQIHSHHLQSQYEKLTTFIGNVVMNFSFSRDMDHK